MYYNRTNPHGGAPDQKQIALDFSVSVNPLGMPARAKAAAKAAMDEGGRYPDPSCRELVGALSKRLEIPGEYLLCGNGSSELIYAWCAAVRPGRVVMPVPTFSEYAAALAPVGAEVLPFALRAEDDFLVGGDLLACVRREAPDALILCNPNNPTGRLIPGETLRALLDFCGAHAIRLFVDECFIELADPARSLMRDVAPHPELFLLRAFTKTYAMAGLRLGYGISSDTKLLAEMAALTPPWNVSHPAQAAGVAALAEEEYHAKSLALVGEERIYLLNALRNAGFAPVPSEANFILFCADAAADGDGTSAEEGRMDQGLQRRLRAMGIEIRDCANFAGLGEGYYRVAVRSHEENRRLADALGAAGV